MFALFISSSLSKRLEPLVTGPTVEKTPETSVTFTTKEQGYKFLEQFFDCKTYKESFLEDAKRHLDDTVDLVAPGASSRMTRSFAKSGYEDDIYKARGNVYFMEILMNQASYTIISRKIVISGQVRGRETVLGRTYYVKPTTSEISSFSNTFKLVFDAYADRK